MTLSVYTIIQETGPEVCILIGAHQTVVRPAGQDVQIGQSIRIRPE